jgi:1-acyl-sn-glycerol-3-phosphate acyltransferase
MWGRALLGGERVPRAGPVLIACNHASYLDPWFVGRVSPRFPLRYLITAGWYHRSRVWRTFFDANGVVPTSADPARTIAAVLACLGRGEAVVVFPEGTISADGRIGRGKHGIAWMAALSGAPVLPVALRGNDLALPRGRIVPRRRPVEVHVGELRFFGDAPVAAPDFRRIEAFTTAVMEEICRLAGQEDRVDASRPLASTSPMLFSRSGGEVVGRRA